ncbi:CHASE3 domain-containing protein [Nocardia sp. NPDC058519]|uniref:sensor histidine kinase n=1 Tax=Nocardia sp. NPDC058519 TaxID=3346535 RepID=UPI0036601165
MRTMTRTGGFIGRLTVQAWFRLVLSLMILVVLVGAVTGARVITRTIDATDRLLDSTEPAAAQVYRLQGTLINQETGLRGYAMTADPQFLEPYGQGKDEEAQVIAHLRELLSDREPLLADLTKIQQIAQQWRAEHAEPLIATLPPNSMGALVTDEVSNQGKVIFDDLRARFDVLDAGLADAIEADRAELAHTRVVRNGVLSGMVLAFLLTALVLAVLVHRLVARPLNVLHQASYRVAAGEFGHHIDVNGPADIAAVAEAVDDMRRRIVTELDAARAQETLLAQQAAELAAQTDELRRSNAELEQFAYVASHDLQEPLRKVASFCQLLEKRYGDKLDDRGKQYIDFAVDGAKRMQVLINDLLTFSRVGRDSGTAGITSVDKSLDLALANLAESLGESDARIERRQPLPELVGDPTLLTMLWQNLIANAVKFHKSGTAPQVTIDCEPAEAEGGWIFSVADNGIGIAPEFAEKVFVIFQRLHNREEYGGTGIGLAISKKIVEHHGGRIWIDPSYVDGTRFCFTLTAPDPVHIVETIPVGNEYQGVPS